MRAFHFHISFCFIIIILFIAPSARKGEHILLVHRSSSVFLLLLDLLWHRLFVARFQVTERIPNKLCAYYPGGIHGNVVLVYLYLIEADKVVDGLSNNLAEESVLAVKGRKTAHSNEELTTIGLRPSASTGHTHHATIPELQSWMDLIWIWTAIDGFTAITGACRISSLNQKVSDDSVEAGAVVIPLKDELAEVSARLWSLCCP
mmetsp:Transcript_633/g.1282  ORF Transcript_633/g.1282 Transcript_633/m.1282 type:complete len:204 (-) Transcript_633:119-730(-)